MSTRIIRREATPWLSRAEFIEWGLRPCAHNGCHVLVNPDELRYCTACEKRRAKRGRNKKLHPRGK